MSKQSYSKEFQQWLSSTNEKLQELQPEQKRSNLWVFIGYPDDSLPADYESIIASWHIPVLRSPVHDADLNADMTEKKNHIHFMIDFGSGQNKSRDQVLQYSNQLKGCLPIICHNKWAMIRYFVHKDNPEKHQYDINDLVAFSGFDFNPAFDTYTSETQLYKFIEHLIYENMIYNYAVLNKYLTDKGYEYEAQFVRKHTLHFSKILDGYYQLIVSGHQKILDPEEKSYNYLAENE